MPATQSATMYAAFGRSLPPNMPLSLVAMRASEERMHWQYLTAFCEGAEPMTRADNLPTLVVHC
jgi:hypothetical protein